MPPPDWFRYCLFVVISSLSGAPGNPSKTTLIASLGAIFRLADLTCDAKAKQPFFREASYLGIQPQVFRGIN